MIQSIRHAFVILDINKKTVFVSNFVEMAYILIKNVMMAMY